MGRGESQSTSKKDERNPCVCQIRQDAHVRVHAHGLPGPTGVAQAHGPRALGRLYVCVVWVQERGV